MGKPNGLKNWMNNVKHIKLSINFLLIILLLPVFLLPLQVQAARGITSDNAGPHFSGLNNQETIEDIRLKVLGGDLRINRVWKGQHWEWNERWDKLEPMQHATTDAQGESASSVLAVYRAGQLYRKTSETETHIVYENQLNQFIIKTAAGYIWNDRKGNGITYDLNGYLINYFDKNAVYVYIERDEAGVIQAIKDHNQNQVLAFAYETYPNPSSGGEPLLRLKTLTDYQGRSLVYGWNTKNQLETVTDVRGQVWTYSYSDKGLLTQLKDPDGRITRYEIDKNGKFTSRFNADGVGERYQYNYDKEKQIYYMSKIDGAGQVEEIWSNAMGRPVRESVNGEDKGSINYILSDGSLGVENLIKNYSRRVEYWYQGSQFVGIQRYCLNGQVTSGECPPGDSWLINKLVYVKYKKVTDLNGNVTTTEYDQWKNEVAVTYPDGLRTSRIMHSQWALPISETNEKGVVTRYEYDERGNLLVLTEAKSEPEERITRYTYDEFGQLKTQTTGESSANNTELAVTEYEYDAYGNITQITDPEGNITRYSDYDALGNARTITDARATVLPLAAQYTWKSTYDAAGNLLARHNPYGRGEVYTYTKTGDLESITSAAGSQVTLGVNANGLPLTLTDSNNKVTKLEYDKASRLTFTTDANGNKTQIMYDAQGRVFRTLDAEANATQFTYVDGLLRNIQHPTYKEVLEYDTRDRIKQSTQQANSRNYIRHRGYDKLGNLEDSTDAESHKTTYSYDALNRVTRIADAEGGVTGFTYDARDNLLQVSDPEGRLTIYTYDKNNRLLSETKDGDQNTVRQRTYGYDQNGNLTKATNPEQEKTTYEFDQADRLVKTQVFANKNHTQPIKRIDYSFDNKNHLSSWSQQASASLPEGVTPTGDVIPLGETYSYNNLEQLESVTANFGLFSKTYSYTYYPNGLKKTYTNPEGVTYTYYYNKNNQLMAVHIPGEGQISWAEFNWMVPQTLLLPGGQKISLRYDDFRQLKERALTTADDTELARAVYEYDLEQNITRIEKGEGVFSYGYDKLYRLASATPPAGYAANDETFAYDGVGNRTAHTENSTTTNQGYNQKNQLQTIEQGEGEDEQSTSFTYNANGHTHSKTQHGIVTRYDYNHEERLIAVKRDGLTLGSYAYNPNGQRIKKTVNGNTTWYLYNENGLAAEYTSTGQLIKEYHFHPQKTWMTDPLFQRTAGGDVYYYHNDHLGTPQQLVDASGNVVWEAQYSAFGKAYITVSAVENNLRFPGQYYDKETNLNHNYFRDYDPELGRYIQSDPIGLRGGINTFSYAEGHPLSLLDPLGLMSIGHKPDMALLPGCEKIVLSDKSKNMNKIITGDPYIYKSKLLFAAAFPIPGGKKAATTIFLEYWIQVSYHYSINIEDVTYVIKCKEVDECGVEKVVEHSGYYYLENQTRLPDIVKKWTEYNMKNESTMGPKK